MTLTLEAYSYGKSMLKDDKGRILKTDVKWELVEGGLRIDGVFYPDMPVTLCLRRPDLPAHLSMFQEQSFPARTLRNGKRFVIEIGEDGFNAYLQRENEELELFAASSSMATYAKVMAQMVKVATGDSVEFQVSAGVPLRDDQAVAPVKETSANRD